MYVLTPDTCTCALDTYLHTHVLCTYTYHLQSYIHVEPNTGVHRSIHITQYMYARHVHTCTYKQQTRVDTCTHEYQTCARRWHRHTEVTFMHTRTHQTASATSQHSQAEITLDQTELSSTFHRGVCMAPRIPSSRLAPPLRPP